MISSVHVYSRARILDVLASGQLDGSNHAVISIHDEMSYDEDLKYASFSGGNWIHTQSGRAILSARGIHHAVSLMFGDITPESVSHRPELLDILMTRRQATILVAFVRALLESPTEHTLLVHCAAGISRSAAIALFATRLAGLDEEILYRRHPHIMPNPYVLSSLSDISGLTASRNASLAEVFQC